METAPEKYSSWKTPLLQAEGKFYIIILVKHSTAPIICGNWGGEPVSRINENYILLGIIYVSKTGTFTYLYIGIEIAKHTWKY